MRKKLSSSSILMTTMWLLGGLLFSQFSYADEENLKKNSGVHVVLLWGAAEFSIDGEGPTKKAKRLTPGDSTSPKEHKVELSSVFTLPFNLITSPAIIQEERERRKN